MANYLPVLLVSVSAGMPDDASLQPLPRGQVDYLSHDWQEEDVWRSWRNMTKQKNEIANGVRLENASWRTWWKQRNKLKTISPETLNWLKDSDVTWLYGPLHTAVDWKPPPKSSTSSSSNVDTAPSSSHKSITSPSSSVALDMYPAAHGYGYQSSFQNSGQGTGMKPILKHRSISEMLTSALPPSPVIDGDGASAVDDEEEDEENCAGRVVFGYGSLGEDGRPVGVGGRPPMFHTKSDTNILRRFGNRSEAPRVAAAASSSTTPPRNSPFENETSEEGDRSFLSASRPSFNGEAGNVGAQHHQPNARLSHSKRSSSSGNLADLPSASSTFSTGSGFPWSGSCNGVRRYSESSPGSSGASSGASSSAVATMSGSSSGSQYVHSRSVMANSQQSLSRYFNGGVDSGSIALRRQDGASPTGNGSGQLQQQQPTQKKHISFNAIVQQCIAIDDSPSQTGLSRSERLGDVNVYDGEDGNEALMEDDGYDEDEEDGPGDCTRSSSDSEDVFDEDEDEEVLEIRTPSSRRSSNSSSDGTYRASSVRSQTPISQVSSALEQHAQARSSLLDERSTTSSSIGQQDSRPSFRDSGRPGRGRGSAKFSRSSRSKSGSTSASSSSRSRSTQTSDRDHVTIAPIAPTYLKAGGSTSSDDNPLYMGYRSFGVGSGRWRSGMGGGDERVYLDTFDATELGVEPSVTDYGMHHQHVANGQGAFNVYPWLNQDARVVDLDDSRFQDTEDHVGGNDKSHFERSPRAVIRATILRHGIVERETAKEVCGQIGKEERMRHNSPTSPMRDEATLSSSVAHHDGKFDGASDSAHSGIDESVADSDCSPPFCNPRVSSLRAEASSRTVANINDSVADINNLVPPLPTPTLAIPTPGISPAHIRDQDLKWNSSSPQMPGYLSPQDASPSRGRSPCRSPVSGYLTTGSTTSSSGLYSNDSRSVSESRSDSRGRSRTRGSSASVSDQEPERGRSRSRSTASACASGANSPLSDSNSPSTRRGPGIGGRHAHSGRVIRDGRGVGLYRKTSEDDLLRTSHVRGREHVNHRISESLSPPGAVGSYDESCYLVREALDGSAKPAPRYPTHRERKLSPSSDGSAGGYVISNRVLPPSIPEEDEQRLGTEGQTTVVPKHHRYDASPSVQQSPSRPTLTAPLGSNRDTSCGHAQIPLKQDGSVPSFVDASNSEALASTLVGKAAGIISSTRGLLGSIWTASA